MQIRSHSEEETERLGRALAELLAPGDVIALCGPLGAGKTRLAQAIGAGLGVTEPVTSPTFNLVHDYVGRVPVLHLDLYRLRGPEEARDLGWDELLQAGGVVLIEWADRVELLLPPDYLEIRAAWGEGPEQRDWTLLPHGTRMDALLDRLSRRLGTE
jgi:tRNA threonylcarbamoyladenosine biosynthesis protein TsaE